MRAKVFGVVLALLNGLCAATLLVSLFVEGPVMSRLAMLARVGVATLLPVGLLYAIFMERRKGLRESEATAVDRVDINRDNRRSF